MSLKVMGPSRAVGCGPVLPPRGGSPASAAAAPGAQPVTTARAVWAIVSHDRQARCRRSGSASFVFYKSGPPPAEGRPVAVFFHAWGAPNPQVYGGWIDHLARTGFVVVFPRFQEVNRTRPADAAGNALRAMKAAFTELATDPDAKPEPCASR